MNLVYLIGPPAAGKSTLMAALTAGCGRSPRAKPLAHDVLIEHSTAAMLGLELGKHRPRFPGTDALSLSVAPVAKAFLASQPATLILGEGDRLAYPGFFDAAADCGYAVTGVYVLVPEAELDRRCAQRGSTQPPSWRRGRATKAARLAEHLATRHRLIDVDGALDPADNAQLLADAVPALGVLPMRVPL